MHEVDDGFVVFDASTDRVHYLNPTATVVFSLCDGTRTTEEVAELVQLGVGARRRLRSTTSSPAWRSSATRGC